jgi:hypothetical protein
LRLGTQCCQYCCVVPHMMSTSPEASGTVILCVLQAWQHKRTGDAAAAIHNHTQPVSS